jgi:hypothetical protein
MVMAFDVLAKKKARFSSDNNAMLLTTPRRPDLGL